ncbi:hypothetical protein GCM10010278_61540 [Streptomyces melanogenes]|nr:hypothetical protein GCM10010278_61540 [Streptomyces melanogenes]
MEEGVAAGERHLTHRGAELRGLLIIERREERGAPQNVVHEFSPCRPVQGTVLPILPDGVNSAINHTGNHKDDAPERRTVRQGADWGGDSLWPGRMSVRGFRLAGCPIRR